jgi:AcrR family transcriptional regulator
MTVERPVRPGPRSRAAEGTRRERAVARSVDPARVRAEKRLQRFLDAALELIAEASGPEFTVQEVVERSGQSLRSFYQYFAGKHELVLALFEESVRSAADRLRAAVAAELDETARLRRFVLDYHRMCSPQAPMTSSASPAAKAPPIPTMAEWAQRLLTDHPREAARAYAPLVELFEELLRAAEDAGVARPGLAHRRLAGVVLQAIMFNAFAAIISSSPRVDDDTAAEELWALVRSGIGSGPAADR